MDFGTKFDWNVNFGTMLRVPKLMKIFKICTEVLVLKFVYPVSNENGPVTNTAENGDKNDSATEPVAQTSDVPLS